MFARALGSVRTRIVQSAKLKITAAKEKVASTFTLPKKYKGTIVEKWAKYWTQLGIDYKDVAVGVAKQIREKPIKASIYATTGTLFYYCWQNNPTEIQFLQQLRNYNAEMVLVNESSQNPETRNYMQFIERSYNEGIIRHLNLGILSLLWLDNYDQSLGLYKATCKYTKPEYLNFQERIIDVGFLNKWWALENKMKDYDVHF